MLQRPVELAQYTSAEFARFCQANRLRTSTGRTGVCWDNATAESFFGALKNEMYYRQSFPDRARARFAVADYIEVFYNRRRLHSALGYRTPFEALTESRPQQPLHDQQPEKLSKIVDTAHMSLGASPHSRPGAVTYQVLDHQDVPHRGRSALGTWLRWMVMQRAHAERQSGSHGAGDGQRLR